MSYVLDRELQRPRWGSQLLGGDAFVDFGRRGTTPYDELIPPNTPIQVEDAQGIFHLTRMTEPGMYPAPQVSMLPHRALGYSEHAKSQVYHESQTWPGGTALETIFADTLAKCPRIASSNELISYLGRTLSQASPDFVGQDMQAVWIELQRYGTSLGQPFVWLVRAHPSGTSGTPYLEVKPRPTTPSLFVDLKHLDPGSLLQWPVTEVRNRVIVRYRVPGDDDTAPTTAIVVVEDTPSQATWPTGIDEIREYYRDVSSRIDNAADATAFATQLLDDLKVLRATGTRLSVTWPHPILDEFDQPSPLWRTTELIGQVIRILNLTIDGPYERDLLIVDAQWDDPGRRVELACEKLGSLIDLWGRLEEEQDDRLEKAVEKKIDEKLPGLVDDEGGGFSVHRDQPIRPVSYTGASSNGGGDNLALQDHVHAGRTGWAFHFGGVGTALNPTMAATLIAPYAALATDWWLVVDPDTAVGFTVTKNGAFWFSASGANGTHGTMGEVPENQLAEGDVIVATYNVLVGTAPTRMLFQLQVGKGT